MIWFATFFLLAFWLLAGVGGLGLLTVSGGWWVPALAGGVACTGAWTWKTRIVAPAWLGWAGLAALPAGLLLPFPYSTPAFLLAAAGALWLVPRGRRMAASAALAASILAVQGIVVAAVPWLSARIHEVRILEMPFAVLLGLTGAEISVHSGRIFVQAGGGIVHAFKPLVEMLAIWPLLPFAIPGLIWVRRPWRFGGILLAFICVRFVIVSALFLDRGDVGLFASPWGFLVSCGVLAFALSRWLPVPRPEGEKLWVAPAGSSAVAFSLAAAGALFAGGAVWYRDPGEPKGGRILVDEAHSNWEWTEEALTKETYGEKTVYNYYSMVDYVRKFYPKVDRNHDRLSLQRLREYDVLVLKTPTRPYSPDEIEAVHAFVRGGGGLWLIGDHTDVLGMNTHLNSISREFGIEFQPDSICGFEAPWKQTYRPPAAGRHPVIATLPPTLFATSCSLRCSAGVRPVIISRDSFGDEIDYGTENFVADMTPSAHEPFGSFIQCAAARYGGGRVLAFGDSTLFSNFFFHLPGVNDLAMGSLDWLNRRDRRPNARLWLGVLAALAAVTAAAGMIRSRRLWLPVALPGAVLGLGMSLAATDALARAERPAPREAFVTIGFDYEKPSYRMPVRDISYETDRRSYHTFYVWMQRMGFVPRLRERLREAFADDVVVLIEPRKDVEIEALRAYVEGGGKLLLMDDPANEGSTADRIARAFGLGFGVDGRDAEFRAATGDFSGIHLRSFRTVRGGRPVLQQAEGGRAVLAIRDVGRGQVAVFGAARIFSVEAMGSTGDIPGEDQMAVFRLQYWLFEQVLGLKNRLSNLRRGS